jgi:hypothetical protein
MKYILMLSSALLGAQAQAAPSLVIPNTFCTAAKAIMAKSGGCEDNRLFTEAAKLCVTKVDLETKKLGVDIKSLQRLGSKSQQGDMKLAAKEYFELTRKLDYLIGTTEIARIDTFNYIEHLYRPEDEADDPKENMEVACFGDNVKALESIANQLDKKQYELEAVLELTKAQLLKTQSNSADMGTIQPSALPDSAPAQKAAPAGPKGKNWNASDISGTEKKKETPKKQ